MVLLLVASGWLLIADDWLPVIHLITSNEKPATSNRLNKIIQLKLAVIHEPHVAFEFEFFERRVAIHR